jgi:hypothetical protein
LAIRHAANAFPERKALTPGVPGFVVTGFYRGFDLCRIASAGVEYEGHSVTDQAETTEFRRKVGFVGVTASVTMFSIVIVAFCLLEASFRTWTVGQYFTNRAAIFADLFIITAACSLITLILSCLCRGKHRGVGIAFSVATLALVIFIFSTNT